MKSVTKEELEKFFKDLGIKIKWINSDNVGFSRTLSFNVYGITYIIEWFCNESTLKIGLHKRAARIPFKYIYFNRTYPLIGGNKSIGFSYTRKDKQSIADSEYPYETFKIPIEIK